MPVKPFTKLLLSATVALAAGTSAASAEPMLTLGITGNGAYSVDTVNIESTTSNKTIPGLEFVSSAATSPGVSLATDLNINPNTPNNTPVYFPGNSSSTTTAFTLPTRAGDASNVPFTVDVGYLTFSFTGLSINPYSPLIVASGTATAGAISEQFVGSVTADSSPTLIGQTFLGASVLLSETCTQSSTGALVTCSESTITPAPQIPEPASMALLGAGLFGLGMARRRRS